MQKKFVNQIAKNHNNNNNNNWNHLPLSSSSKNVISCAAIHLAINSKSILLNTLKCEWKLWPVARKRKNFKQKSPHDKMMTTVCMAFYLNTSRLLRYYFPYLMKISLQINSLFFFSPLNYLFSYKWLIAIDSRHWMQSACVAKYKVAFQSTWLSLTGDIIRKSDRMPLRF